jgi:hypothetical protein
MRWWTLGVVATLMITCGVADAAGRKRAAHPSKQAAAPPHMTSNKQAAIGAYGRAVYPKYYWGLHVREFQNIGTPPGDRGIRGDGTQWQPW